MLTERRDWILKEKEKFTGVKKDPIPANIEAFYDRKEDDEEENAAAEDGAAAEPAAKGKKDKKAKGKKGKGGGDDGGADGESKYAKVGPNELVKKFDNFYDDYKRKW